MRLYTLKPVARIVLGITILILQVCLTVYRYRFEIDFQRPPAPSISGFYGPGPWLAFVISAIVIAILCTRGQEGDGLSDIIAVGGYTAIACFDMLLHLPLDRPKSNHEYYCLDLSSSFVEKLSRYAAARSVVDGSALIFTIGMAWSLCDARQQGWQNFPSTRSVTFIAGSITFKSVSTVGGVLDVLLWDAMRCRPGATKLSIYFEYISRGFSHTILTTLVVEGILTAIGYLVHRFKLGTEEENGTGLFFRVANGAVFLGMLSSPFLLVPGLGFPLSFISLTDLDQFAALISVCILTIGRLCIWWIYRPVDLSRDREAWQILSYFRSIRM